MARPFFSSQTHKLRLGDEGGMHELGSLERHGDRGGFAVLGDLHGELHLGAVFQSIGILPALAGFAGGLASYEHRGFLRVAEEAEELLAFLERLGDVLVQDALGAGFALGVEDAVVGGIVGVLVEVAQIEGGVHVAGFV